MPALLLFRFCASAVPMLNIPHRLVDQLACHPITLSLCQSPGPRVQPFQSVQDGRGGLPSTTPASIAPGRPGKPVKSLAVILDGFDPALNDIDRTVCTVRHGAMPRRTFTVAASAAPCKGVETSCAA